MSGCAGKTRLNECSSCGRLCRATGRRGKATEAVRWGCRFKTWGCGGMADAGDLIPDELSDRYKAYACKDVRVRVYNKDSKKVTSYPRFLMEQALGRPLEKKRTNSSFGRRFSK